MKRKGQSKMPKVGVKCLTRAWCYHLRPHVMWPPKIIAPHAPPQKIKGTGCARGCNCPQSNQPQLPSTVIGFRAISTAAIINFKQAPACPRHCLSLQFICWVSQSLSCDEWITTTGINIASHQMLCIIHTHIHLIPGELQQGNQKVEEVGEKWSGS